MGIKKYGCCLAVTTLCCVQLQAQSDAGYNWKDSSKVAVKNMPQYAAFTANEYPYPPKARNMWELGFGGGLAFILGDVAGKADVGGSVTLRKAISHTFSVRAGYFGSYSQGYPTYEQALTGKRAFQNRTHRAGLDFIASVTPNSHHGGNGKINLYALAGADLIATEVFFRAPGQARAVHYGGNYAVFYGVGIPDTKEGTLTTFGGNKFPNPNGRESWTLLGGASAGAGVAYKISKRMNVGLEQRFTMVKYDYLDAIKSGNANDTYSLTTARLNFNIGKSGKRSEPLWWLNANNFIYDELNSPQHMKIPTPVLPDTDGDGVTDQFDMEPNTPAGAPVDVRGIAKDSDADGVPDYKDKELLTPQKCFPVNADGVGNCPEAGCCTELKNKLESAATSDGFGRVGGFGGICTIGSLPEIQFKTGKAVLSNKAISALLSVSTRLKASPTCRLKVVGYGTNSKKAQQLSWERVNTVIRYLIEKHGISEDRFIFSYGEVGEMNIVNLIGTKETGPSTVAAPHPDIRLK